MFLNSPIGIDDLSPLKSPPSVQRPSCLSPFSKEVYLTHRALPFERATLTWDLFLDLCRSLNRYLRSNMSPHICWSPPTSKVTRFKKVHLKMGHAFPELLPPTWSSYLLVMNMTWKNDKDHYILLHQLSPFFSNSWCLNLTPCPHQLLVLFYDFRRLFHHLTGGAT